MKKARLILADDHRLVAEGLRSLLTPDYDLVALVDDGRALLEAVDHYQPDAVVVDISMPLLNGIEAVRLIKKKNSRVKVIFLTMHQDLHYALSALEAGASGYVLKHSAPTELLQALREALAGRIFVSPTLAEKIDQQPNQQRPREFGLAQLTARQRQVLQLLCEGHSAKEAAAILGISVRTVEFHKYGMMDALGFKSLAELIRFALTHGPSV